MDELTVLRAFAPETAGPEDGDRRRARARLAAEIAKASSRRKPHRRIVAGMVIGAVSVAAGTAAATLFRESPSPGAERARELATGATELVIDEATSQACLVARAGRASGSSCTSLDAPEILFAVVSDATSRTVGVFDPLQRAVRVRQGGTEAVEQTSGGRRYFVIRHASSDEPIEVIDGSGAVIETHRAGQ